MVDKPLISIRKPPKQARSKVLVAAILEAAVHVLREQGAQKFTTARVAERAGVSIGSLYQYFPNKAAILYRLQSDEWRDTAGVLAQILDEAGPPAAILRRLTQDFVASECAEAVLRGALTDAAPFYRRAAEDDFSRRAVREKFLSFLASGWPDLDEATRRRAGALIASTLEQQGKDFSRRPRRAREISVFAQDLTEMFCAWLDVLVKKQF